MEINLHDIPLDVFFKYFDSKTVSYDTSWTPVLSDFETSGYYKETFTDKNGQNRVLETYLGYPLLKNTLDSGNLKMVERVLNYDLDGVTTINKQYVSGNKKLYKLALKKLGFKYFAETTYEYCALLKINYTFKSLVNITVVKENGSVVITDHSYSPAKTYPNANIVTFGKIEPLPTYSKHYIVGLEEQFVILNNNEIVGYLYKNLPVKVHEIDVNSSSTDEIARRYKKENDDSSFEYASYTLSSLPEPNLIKYHKYIRSLKDKSDSVDLINSRIIHYDEIYYANTCVNGRLYMFDYSASARDSAFELKYKLSYNTTVEVSAVDSSSAEYQENIDDASVREVVMKNGSAIIEGVPMKNKTDYRFYTVFSSANTLVIPNVVGIRYVVNTENKGVLTIPYNDDTETVRNLINNTSYSFMKIDSTFKYYHIDGTAIVEDNYIRVAVTPMYKYFELRSNNTTSGKTRSNVETGSSTGYYRDSKNPASLFKVVITTELEDEKMSYIPSNKEGKEDIKESYNTRTDNKYINANLLNNRATPISNKLSNIYDSSLMLLGINTTSNQHNTIYESLSHTDSAWLYKDYLYCSGLGEHLLTNITLDNDRNLKENEGINYVDLDGYTKDGFIKIKDSINYLLDNVPTNGFNTISTITIDKGVTITDEQIVYLNNLLETSNPFERLLNYSKYQTLEKQKKYYERSYTISNTLSEITTKPVYSGIYLSNKQSDYYDRLNKFQDLKKNMIDFFTEYYLNLSVDRLKEDMVEIYNSKYLPKLEATMGIYSDETTIEQSDAIIDNKDNNSKRYNAYKYLFTEDNENNTKLFFRLLKERGI